MTKKNKGINYDNEPLTVLDLLARLNQEYERRMKELKARQDMDKATRIATIQKEKEITNLIAKEKKIIEKMQQDFSDFEIDTEAKAREEASKGVLREADVRTGKISLKDFILKGKKNSEIQAEVVEKVTEELELATKAIRAKNLEILKLQKELYQHKQGIRNQLNQPGFQFLEMLKGMEGYGNEQMNLFAEYMPSYHFEIKETERKLFLCEGKSIGGGQNWEKRTVKEAKKIVFDPILPVDLIPKLRSQLSGLDDDDIVSVSFLFRGHDIDVRIIKDMRRVITTSPDFIIHGFKEKEKKNVKTSDLKE